MVKRNKKAQQGNKQGKGKPRSRNIARIMRGIDAGAMAWRRLLDDPCNAPLVPGCFPGIASGMLYRTRTVQGFGVGGTDASMAAMVFFHPAYGGTAGGTYCPLQWASVNAADGIPNTKYGTTIGGIPQYGQYRCVAACMKLRYTGSELNRAGIVGHVITNDPPFTAGTPGGTASSDLATVSAYLQGCQTTYRLGEANHEVRWAPAFEDGEFQENTPGIGNLLRTGNAIGFVITGYPKGTVYAELTAVWEVIPDTGSGLVPPVMVPSSNNTVNQVLRTIGDIGRWATDPNVQRGVYNIAKTAVGVGRAMYAAAPSVAGLLTL